MICISTSPGNRPLSSPRNLSQYKEEIIQGPLRTRGNKVLHPIQQVNASTTFTQCRVCNEINLDSTRYLFKTSFSRGVDANSGESIIDVAIWSCRDTLFTKVRRLRQTPVPPILYRSKHLRCRRNNRLQRVVLISEDFADFIYQRFNPKSWICFGSRGAEVRIPPPRPIESMIQATLLANCLLICVDFTATKSTAVYSIRDLILLYVIHSTTYKTAESEVWSSVCRTDALWEMTKKQHSRQKDRVVSSLVRSSTLVRDSRCGIRLWLPSSFRIVPSRTIKQESLWPNAV